MMGVRPMVLKANVTRANNALVTVWTSTGKGWEEFVMSPRVYGLSDPEGWLIGSRGSFKIVQRYLPEEDCDTRSQSITMQQQPPEQHSNAVGSNLQLQNMSSSGAP